MRSAKISSRSSMTATARGSTVITGQLPHDRWGDFLRDPTVADEILDRIPLRAHPLKRSAAPKDGWRRIVRRQ
jgi:hypothetical protein